MKEREMAKRNLVLQAIVGSRLYGTQTESSDTDYMGIFIPDKEYVLGTSVVEQVEIKTNPSSNPRANTKDDTDCVIYSLPKFFRMLTANNPTALELLFCGDQVVYDTQIGRRIIANAHLFISQKAKHTYCGYAFAQKCKVLNKKDRYSQFVVALDRLNSYLAEGITKLPVRLEMNTDLVKAGFWKVIEKGEDVLAAKQKLEKELAEYGRRLEQVKTLGYDPKFICHVVRLLDEGIELLQTGRLTMPLPSAPLVLEIKQGRHPLPWILKEIDAREAKIEEVFKTCKLQHTADLKAINKLQVELLEEFYYGLGSFHYADAGIDVTKYAEIRVGPEPTTTVGHNRKEG